MAGKRVISIRKVLRALLTVACIVGCVMAFSSASRYQSEKTLKGVRLRIANAGAVKFLNETSLRELLFQRRHIDPKELTLAKTDVHRLESIARSNPWVQDAQAYIDNGAVLHITVTQRVPIVRVFEATGASYYLDTALQQLPLSMEYTHYAPVITGVPTLRNDSASKAVKGSIVALTRKIANDTFWRAGVEEIAMNNAGEFELVPVLGTHRVMLGDTSNLDKKLNNLFLFYKNVLNRIGWDRYTSLDVRYAGQVVASPALPWTPPVDRALSNMNWVKSIVGADTKDESVTPPSAPSASAPAVAVKPAVTVPKSLVSKPSAPVTKIKPAEAKKTTVNSKVKPSFAAPSAKPKTPSAKVLAPKKESAKATSKSLEKKPALRH